MTEAHSQSQLLRNQGGRTALAYELESSLGSVEGP